MRYGYRRIHVLLRREGWPVNPKCVCRLYREMGLQLRNKTPKRRVKAKLRSAFDINGAADLHLIKLLQLELPQIRNVMPSLSKNHMIPVPETVQPELLDLPPVGLKRWSARRKAILLSAVKSRLLSIESACEMYGLTIEELQSWQKQAEKFGPQGLFVTKIQRYRETFKRGKSKSKADAVICISRSR